MRLEHTPKGPIKLTITQNGLTSIVWVNHPGKGDSVICESCQSFLEPLTRLFWRTTQCVNKRCVKYKLPQPERRRI